MLLSELQIPNNNVVSDKLVIALHGLGGNGNQHMISTGLDTIDNATVICPTSPTQNEDGENQWQMNLSDTFWLMGLRHYMIENHGIDPDKVNICGQSNGGAKSYDVANEFPGAFKSVTVTSAYFPKVTSKITARVKHIHGDEDLIAPIDNILTNTFPKLKAGAAPFLFITVAGAGHSVEGTTDGLPTLNEKLGEFNSSVLIHIKDNAGL